MTVCSKVLSGSASEQQWRTDTEMSYTFISFFGLACKEVFFFVKFQTSCQYLNFIKKSIVASLGKICGSENRWLIFPHLPWSGTDSSFPYRQARAFLFHSPLCPHLPFTCWAMWAGLRDADGDCSEPTGAQVVPVVKIFIILNITPSWSHLSC